MGVAYIYIYRKILSKDKGVLNRTQLRILFACIFVFFLLTSVLTVIYALNGWDFLLWRMAVFAFLYAFLLYTFFNKENWQFTAHVFLCCLVLMIWSNTIWINRELYVINLQYFFLIVSAAYYLLGAKGGAYYSIAAMLPVAFNILSSGFLVFSIPLQKIHVNYVAYDITVLTNFSLILYIHYLFFRSLTKFKKRG